MLRRNEIQTLFHFTDAANLDSIRKHGLMSAATLNAQSITSVMNSDELSRKLDQDVGLQDYVRLSFNDQNPMQFKVLEEKRASNLVMLKVKLEVVSRPGVMFSDCNATRNEAVKSVNPDIVRFDIVKAKNQFQVSASLRHFYQAEVLVPSPIPPHLIVFPGSVAEDIAIPVVNQRGSQRGEKNALSSRSKHKNTVSVHRHGNLPVHVDIGTCGAKTPRHVNLRVHVDTRTCVRAAETREPAASNESAQGPTSALAAVVVIPKQARVEEAVVDQVSHPVALVDVLVPVPVDPVALAPEPLVPSDTADEVTEVKVPSLPASSAPAKPSSPPRPQSVFVSEPRPHAQDMYFNGVWICKCGETDCPYAESGFSPKKQESPRIVVPVWCPELSTSGSSSTDSSGTQRNAKKVGYLSSYESGDRELCVISVGARSDSNSSQLQCVSGPVLARPYRQPSCVSGPVSGQTQAQSESSSSLTTTSRQCESKAPSRQQQTSVVRSLRSSQTEERARSFRSKAPGSSRQQ